MGLDFKAVSEAVLRAYATILPTWMGGKRVGDEWVAERRKNGGPGDSWSINLKTGVWSHFASGRKGHDPIGLYAALNNLEQGAACKQIQQQLGMHQSNVPVLPSYAPIETHSDPPPDPIPFDAPQIQHNPRYGQPSGVYRYGDAFVVVRYDFIEDGEPRKIFTQFTWRNGQWVARGYGDHRPLYHVEQLPLHPGARVLVVEGEKCVHLAEPLLTSFVVLTWSGGSSSWRKSDWTPIKGREVIIWPDADDAGREAAAGLAASLHGLASSVKVLNPNGAAPGWDIGDAIDKEKWATDQIMEWMRNHMGPAIESTPAEDPPAREVPPRDNPPADNTPPTSELTTPTDDSPSAIVSWEDLGLDTAGGKVPHPNIANASRIIQMYRNFRGRVWFDEFRGEIYHTLSGDHPIPWTDADTRRVTVAIQQQLRLHKFSERIVRDGIQHAAECQSRNSLTEWLNSLTWDGQERLSTWLSDTAGVEANDYTQAIARNWLIAMVARAFKPGCKMDNIPVLEGVSGLNKSQFLEVLGGEWYEALPMEFGTKDFLQSLQGIWLAEIPDMTGFAKADHTRVISLLSVPRDKFRKAYGHTPERFQRTTIFAATSEDDDYLTDSRGKRRFWPVRCTDIDLNALRLQRDQLFAEAVTAYRAGETWYQMPASAAIEQEHRLQQDTWVEMIRAYVDPIWDQQTRSSSDGYASGIPMSHIMMDALKLTAGQHGMRELRRAASIMRSLGWRIKHTNLGNLWRKTTRKD